MRISDGRFAYCFGCLNSAVPIHTALFLERQFAFPFCTVGISAGKKVNNTQTVCHIIPLFYHTTTLRESDEFFDAIQTNWK
jgi:hypothetical protein